MKRRIQEALLSSLIFLLLSIPAVASDLPKQISITMTEEGNLPYQHGPYKGKKIGLYVEIVKEAAKKIGISITFKPYPWKRCLVMMETGRSDAIIGVLKNQTLQNYLYFVEEPLAYEETTMFTYRGSNITFDGNLNDIYKYKVGLIRGATFHDEWEKKKGNFIRLEESNKMESLIKKLSHKRIDLIIGNKFIIQHNLKKLNLNNEIILIDARFKLNSGHLAFSKIKGESHKALAEAFNNAIKEIKESDIYMEIVNKYIDY